MRILARLDSLPEHSNLVHLILRSEKSEKSEKGAKSEKGEKSKKEVF